MPNIQSSINSALGTIARVKGINKFFKNQEDLINISQQQMADAQAREERVNLEEQANRDLEKLGEDMAGRNYGPEMSAFGESRPMTRSEQVLARAYQAGISAEQAKMYDINHRLEIEQRKMAADPNYSPAEPTAKYLTELQHAQRQFKQEEKNRKWQA